MPSTVFNSAIFRDAFGTPAMRAVFCDEAFDRPLRRGRGGARPRRRAGSASSRPKPRRDRAGRRAPTPIDLAKLKAETDIVGYPIIGLVHQMRQQCGEAGRYLHWGATTQDIMDTATVLQIRDALALVEADLAALDAALAALAAQASRHGDGRPHPPAARAAGHLRLQGRRLARRMIRRHRERLAQLEAARAGRRSSPARPARSPRSATRASRCTMR